MCIDDINVWGVCEGREMYFFVFCRFIKFSLSSTFTIIIITIILEIKLILSLSLSIPPKLTRCYNTCMNTYID